MKHIKRIWVPIAIAFLFAAFQFSFSASLDGVRERGFDIYQRLLPRDVPLDQVAIVAIDDASLSSFGRWPWPRQKVGEVVALIEQSGAAAIGLDLLFPEPDLSDQGRASDAAFAATLRQSPSVLAMTLAENGEKLALKRQAGFTFIGDGDPPVDRGYPGGIAPIEMLSRAASGLGVIRSFADDDGRMRAIPLIWAEEPEVGVLRYWPAFSVEMLRVAQMETSITARTFGGPDDALKVGAVIVPLTDGGLRLIDVPSTPLTISAKKLIDGGPQQALENRIVILAVDAAGVDRYHLTARGNLRLGADLHAIAVSQMLNSSYLTRIANSGFIEMGLFVGLVCALIINFLFLGRHPLFVTSFAILICAVPGAAGLWFYAERSVLLDATQPTLGLLLAGIGGGYALYREAEHRRVSLQMQFSQFLSPEVVKQLAETDSVAALAAEDRNITIMLLDVRGFTTMSEQYGGKAMVEVVNHFFAIASDEIFKRGGTIDKYMGDAVLAFWNAPLDQPDHAERAFECAQAILDRVRRENHVLEKRELPAIKIVAVLETGVCSVGNMGTTERIDYTAIGPAVNLVARLEKVAKEEGHLLVTGPACAAALSRPMLKVAKVEVRGFKDPVEVYVP